jgi:hypothetical protein
LEGRRARACVLHSPHIGVRIATPQLRTSAALLFLTACALRIAFDVGAVLSNAIEEVHMIRNCLLSSVVMGLALFIGSASARADTKGDAARARGKLTVSPAVLTSNGAATAPITEVRWGPGYRRGWYGYPYRSYSYGYYPRSAYYPGYGYGYGAYPAYGYSYYRPYYGGYYYPRYYTGYRGFSYYTPGFYGSFYW